MFIYTRLSAQKRFANSNDSSQRNEKEWFTNSSPTDYIATDIFVRPVTAMISHRNVRHTCTNLNPSKLLSAIFISIYTPFWETIMRK